MYLCFFFFFFQAEDGIRDLTVTGVQTCALPISIQVTNDQTPKQNFFADGSRLYVAETVAERSVIGQVSTEGGETSLIPTPFANLNLFDIAPNHSELLAGSFVSGTETELRLWLVPLPS